MNVFSYVCWPSVCLLWKNVYSDPLLCKTLMCYVECLFFDHSQASSFRGLELEWGAILKAKNRNYLSSCFQNFELIECIVLGQSFSKCSLKSESRGGFVKTLPSGRLHQDSDDFHFSQAPPVLLLLLSKSHLENPRERGKVGRRVSQEYFRSSIRKENNFLRLRRGQRSQGPETY